MKLLETLSLLGCMVFLFLVELGSNEGFSEETKGFTLHKNDVKEKRDHQPSAESCSMSKNPTPTFTEETTRVQLNGVTVARNTSAFHQKNIFFDDLCSIVHISMADPALHPETIHHTLKLKEIAIDYCPDACTHSPESDEIFVIFDERGGARWRSKTRFQFGTFGAQIQCPKGNTSGLNFNIYLSSLEGDKSQDEIDFEFLGKDKTIVQTNFYTSGKGDQEKIHKLGFNCSNKFHDYEIKWTRDFIEWSIDGKVVRREERKEGEGFPEKPMFLYSSVWDASYIDEGRWAGPYVGCDAPYVCQYKDVRVPAAAVTESCRD